MTTVLPVLGCTGIMSFLGVYIVLVTGDRGYLMPGLITRTVVGGVGMLMLSGMH